MLKNESYQPAIKRSHRCRQTLKTTTSRTIRIIHVSIRPKSNISPPNKITLPTPTNNHPQLHSYSHYPDIEESHSSISKVA